MKQKSTQNKTFKNGKLNTKESQTEKITKKEK
jgi:hypothetical protein